MKCVFTGGEEAKEAKKQTSKQMEKNQTENWQASTKILSVLTKLVLLLHAQASALVPK
jgi:hypothetical protein